MMKGMALLRAAAGLIPEDTVFPILSGRLRGYKMAGAPYALQYLLGSHEKEIADLFAEAVSNGDVVYDVGAFIGYYSLLASSLVGPRGSVVAFEPLSRNLKLLRRNLGLNHVLNVRIEDAAVAEKEGTALFSGENSRTAGALASNGNMMVRIVSLDEMVEKNRIPIPDVIKMDINGGEFNALLGARALLKNNDVRLFLSTHGEDVKGKCINLLTELDYKLKPIGAGGLGKAHELYASKEE